MWDLPSRTGRAELERQLAKVTMVNSGFKSGILDLTSVYLNASVSLHLATCELPIPTVHITVVSPPPSPIQHQQHSTD